MCHCARISGAVFVLIAVEALAAPFFFNISLSLELVLIGSMAVLLGARLILRDSGERSEWSKASSPSNSFHPPINQTKKMCGHLYFEANKGVEPDFGYHLDKGFGVQVDDIAFPWHVQELLDAPDKAQKKSDKPMVEIVSLPMVELMNLPPAPVCTTQSSVAVSVDNLQALRNQCTIYLGPMGSVDLKASVPDNYQPSIRKAKMFSEFLPEFWNHRTIDWPTAHVNIQKFKQDTVHGLFWDEGWGYAHRAVLYALVLLHKHAYYADDFRGACKYSGTELRNKIEKGEFPLRLVHGDGMSGQIFHHLDGSVLSVSHPSSWVGYALSGDIHVSDTIRVQAALADYYFWWAWRLLSYFTDGEGSLMHYMVGKFCANCALTEITDIASVLVHEWGHISGSSYHCSSGLKQNDCCQYFLEWSLKNRVMAKYALPESHHYDWHNGVGPTNEARFNRLNGSWGTLYRGIQQFNLSRNSCAEAYLACHHDSFFELNHGLTMNYFIPNGCSKGSWFAVQGSRTY